MHGLRIFDPSRSIRAAVTSADVVRSSVRALKVGGSAVVIVPLSSSGSATFCALTRGLARRGARLAGDQHLAVEVAGRIYARPWIDYSAFTRGLCGTPSFEFHVTSLTLARKVASLIGDG